MKVVQHQDVHQFRDRAGPWLTGAEAENNLILGICSDLARHPKRFQAEPYLMSIENETGLAGAALMTPPRSLILTRAPRAAVELLVEHLIRIRAPVPGVLGPTTAANDFTQCWVEKTGSPCRRGMSHRIYQCDRVELPVRRPGRLRAAAEDDLPLLAEWRREFCREVGFGQAEDHRLSVSNYLDDRRLFVWEHGRAVSMAAWAGETRSGQRLGMVYTPPDLRRRGYATSCVASLTQQLFDSGKTRCFLAADLANPTSNGIYRKIGYRPVCDSQTWLFD